MQQLPRIHRYRYVGGACVGKHISGIFRGEPLPQLPVDLPYPLHGLLEQLPGLGIPAYRLRHDVCGLIQRHISLALLREGGYPVPDQLMRQGA
ncbi:hypothetical protein SDC9_123362 [bioreactor metagenome]|uniref:Uncharacterized protein n=1 Tax=bioreactor metagenome TaxID=1076179 RepID=A0A645CHJ1_9ZZZZ